MIQLLIDRYNGLHKKVVNRSELIDILKESKALITKDSTGISETICNKLSNLLENSDSNQFKVVISTKIEKKNKAPRNPKKKVKKIKTPSQKNKTKKSTTVDKSKKTKRKTTTENQIKVSKLQGTTIIIDSPNLIKDKTIIIPGIIKKQIKQEPLIENKLQAALPVSVETISTNTVPLKTKITTVKKQPETENRIHLNKTQEPKEANNQFKSAYDIENDESKPVELFSICNEDWSKFLGKLERKPMQSLVITLDSEEGGGKTHATFQFAHVMAKSGYRPIIWSLEEHRDNASVKQKISKYFDEQTKKIIAVESDDSNLTKEQNYNRILESIMYYDVILVDSWAKVEEIYSKASLDSDFRKKFKGKIFWVIYQRTSVGKMRGGSKGAFDADIVLKGNVDRDNFENNYIYNHKNRYNDHTPISELKYSPFYQSLVPTDEETTFTV